jgi:hypothetical protein
MTKSLKTCGLLLALAYAPHCLATGTIGLPPPVAPLSLLVYKMEVLNYCGLIDDEVSEGFKLRRDHMVLSLDLTPEDVQNARMEGWKFGLAEWQNRGLGGFKNWCNTEGKEIAEYFRNSKIPDGS